MNLRSIKDFDLILRTMRRHPGVVVLLVLECSIAMAILCNIFSIVIENSNRYSTPTGLDEGRITVIQNIGVIGVDDAGGVGDGLRALESLPSVASAAFGPTPFNVSTAPVSLDVEREMASANPYFYFGSQGLAKTLGVQLLEGTMLTPALVPEVDHAFDDEGETQVPALITLSLAERLFPDGHAIGRMIYSEVWGSYVAKMRVIGIVSDFRSAITGNHGDREAVIAEVAMSTHQIGGLYSIRSVAEPSAELLNTFTRSIAKAMPAFVQEPPTTIKEQREKIFAGDNFRSVVLAAILVVVTSTTALGIFGLTRFWILRRREAIGIRRALGARRMDIVIYFMKENLLISTLGAALGAVLAICVNRLLAMGFEVEPLAFMDIGIGCAAILLVFQLASVWSVLGASRVEPSLINSTV